MRAKLFKYISYKYYLHHISHVICIILPIILCISSLFCILQLKTSYEMYQYNKILSDYGDYDFLMYDVTDEDYRKLSDSDYVQKVGKVYRIGTAVYNDVAVSYGVVDSYASDMLSINLTDGRYPEKVNEIIVSKEYLTKIGLPSIVGNTISIDLSSNSDKEVSGEFEIVGIFDKYRYINGSKELKWIYQEGEDSADYAYPDIYLSNNADSNSSTFGFFKNAVVFKVKITKETDDADIYNEIQNGSGELGFLNKYFNDKAHLCHNSRLINDRVLDWSSDDLNSANTMGYNHVAARITNGTVKKDFLTIVILPLLSMAIITIGISSVISSMKTSVYDRKERFYTLSILGMSTKQMISCMSLEILIWALVGTFLGLISGHCIYTITLTVLKDFPSAANANRFISAITLSPYPFIALFIFLYIVLGIAFVIRSIKEKNKTRYNKRKHKIHGSISAINYLHKSDIVMKRNSIFSKIIIITLSFSVIMSYIYVKECQKNEITYQNYDYPYGNYYAERDYYQCRTDDYFENHHESGISPQYIERIDKYDCVNGIYASIINCSSKLVYDEDDPISTKLNKHINEIIQKGRYSPDDVDYASDVEILSKIGYKVNEQLFCTPTIGISDDYLEELTQYVILGEIDIQKIKSGDEVILLQSPLASDDPLYEEYKKMGISPPASSAFDLTEVFNIGDELPLSDVVYDGVTDSNNDINSNSLEYYKHGRNGRRTDFSPKIGAIVKIEDEDIRNMISYMGCDGKQPLFNVLCSVDSFSAWKLPDSNYSRLYVNVNPEDEFVNFEEFWNQMESNSPKTHFESSFEILKSIHEDDRLNTNIFYAVFLVLFFNGILGIVFSVSYSCRIHMKKFAQLYQLGIKKRYFYLFESKSIVLTIIFSELMVWTLFAIIQYYMTRLQIRMDEYLSSHMALEGRLLYLSELLPMKATWFRIDLLLKPSILLSLFLIIVLMITIVIQFHNIRVRRKHHGQD